MAKGKNKNRSKQRADESDYEPEIVIDLEGGQSDISNVDDDADYTSKAKNIGGTDEEPTVGAYMDDSGDIIAVDTPNATPANKRGGFDIASLKLTPAELPLWGYALASIVFFLAAVTRKTKPVTYNGVETSLTDIAYTSDYEGVGSTLRNSHFAYALCLGIFGALMAGGVIVCMRHNNSLAEKRKTGRPFGGDFQSSDGSLNVRVANEDDENKTTSERFLEKRLWLINIVLFVWATFGWAFFTFGGNDVFRYTGNGFFALWAMMLFSVWNFGITKDHLANQARSSESCIYGLALASIISIIELSTGPGYRGVWAVYGISIFALTVCSISLFFGLATVVFAKFATETSRLIEGRHPKIRFYCIVALLVLWIVTACLTTFIGPFLTTGNGYFAVWGAVVCTTLAFVGVQEQMQD